MGDRAPAAWRNRYLVVALTEGGVALLALALTLAVVLRPDDIPQPEYAGAHVAACDFSSNGAAQITYTVTNGDRSRHAYRVELMVANAKAPLGAGVGLVNHVAPGATVTARALVPLAGDPTGARCNVRAIAYDGHSGHHE
jgi:hypothetical protein